MSKTRLVNAIAESNGISKAEAEKAVEMVLDGIPQAVTAEADQRLTLRNFGAFSIKVAKATRRYNPQTKLVMDVPAKHFFDFDPSEALTEFAEAIPLPVEETPEEPTTPEQPTETTL